MSSKYYLPSKISSYLRRVQEEFKKEGDLKLVEIISSSKMYIEEATGFDNWNGGTYSHDVKLFLPRAIHHSIKIDDEKKLTDKILDRLKACASQVSNELINQVHFIEEDETDLECQKAIYLAIKPIVNPETLDIWEKGYVRVFISHRDTHKIKAKELATELSIYGISAFVAHDTIVAMEKWQKVILQGLETMEIMLAFVTDDFHKSSWTNQELGYALARNIPIISLKLENTDPPGFVADTQALRGRLENACDAASNIFDLIANKLGNQNRLQTGLVDALVNSPSYVASRERFERLSNHVLKLNEVELDKIIKAYAYNSQLYGAAYLSNKNRLTEYLSKASGRALIIGRNNVIHNPFEKSVN